MPQNKEEILNIIRDDLVKHSEILSAYVFGSFIESDNWNDIDIAIFIDEYEKLDILTWYEINLSLHLQNILKIPIDIIIMNKAPDNLIHQITKGKLILDRDEDKRLDFILPAWKRYLDFKEKRREFVREILEKS